MIKKRETIFCTIAITVMSLIGLNNNVSANNLVKENTTAQSQEINDKNNSTIIYTNNKEKILDLSDKQYQKIKWEKPFISINILDDNKIKEFKNIEKTKNNLDINDNNIKNIYNRGLSGDFISINQITSGNLKTKYGEFNIFKILDASGNSRLTICNDTICSSDLHLKAIDNVSGVLYGKFSTLLSTERNLLNLQDNDNIGLVKIKIKDLFKMKSDFNVEYSKADNNIYKLTFNNSLNKNILTNDTNQLNKINGILNDINKTEIDLFISENKKQQALTLKDGTRVYTKLTNNPNILDMFYLDWNENDPYNLQIINLGKINRIDLNIN